MIQSQTTEKYFSIVSFWAIAIKVNIGKLKLTKSLDDLLPEGVSLLDLNLAHTLQYHTLALHHHDPFDRMLIAQAQTENLTVMTDDPNFPLYEVALVV